MSKCTKCGTPMQTGIALENTVTGIPDFPGADVVTVSFGGPGRLIECLKCPKCGHSVTNPRDFGHPKPGWEAAQKNETDKLGKVGS